MIEKGKEGKTSDPQNSKPQENLTLQSVSIQLPELVEGKSERKELVVKGVQYLQTKIIQSFSLKSQAVTSRNQEQRNKER